MTMDEATMLDLLRPTARLIAQETIAAGARTTPTVHREQGEVRNVDLINGKIDVRLDGGTLVQAVDLAGDVPAPGEKVWIAIFPPNMPLMIGRVNGQQRRCGRSADVVAPVALSTTPAVVASCIAVTQPNRRLEISCHLPAIQNGGSGANQVGLFVHEDATYIANAGDVQFSASGQSIGFHGVVSRTAPLGGAHTYYLFAVCDSGTATVLADVEGVSPGPVWIAVDDRGSSTA